MPGRRPFARPRMIVFALNGRVASRGVAVLCVDDLQGTESFKTRPGSMSESSPLESYDVKCATFAKLCGGAYVSRQLDRIIRDFEVFWQSLVTGVIAVAEAAHMSPDPEVTLCKPLKTQIERASRVQLASLKAYTASPPGQGSYGQPPKPRSNDCQKT